MVKEITINEKKYEIINDYREALNIEELTSKLTDFFDDYTYIVGDWAYSKLRLKGFYDANDEKCNQTNNIDNLNEYIVNNCAYGCKWFEIKQIKD